MNTPLSLRERLAKQRDAVAASGLGADDALQVEQPRIVKFEVAPQPVATIIEDPPETEPTTRTQGIPISASDDALITEMEAFCRRRKIKMRRNSNVSLITRAGWRLLHDLMQRDPEAFAAAIEAGRPARIVK